MFKCKIYHDYVMDPRNSECSYAADGNLVCKTNKIVPKPSVDQRPPPPPKAVETFFNKR